MPLRLVAERRAHVIDRAETCPSREEVIAPYVAQGSVLDLGVVNSRRSRRSIRQTLAEFSTSLHERIRQLNPNVVGVDIDSEGVAILRARGYNVLWADVETLDLQRRFDTIVAGEIIEHLANPGQALACLRRHLMPSGQLILSTCNPFYVGQFWKILKYNNVQVHEEHTCWFDPHTLGHLLNLTGYDIDRVCWIGERRRHGRLRLWPTLLRRYFNPSFIIVASLAGDPDGGEPCGSAEFDPPRLRLVGQAA